PTPTDVEPPEDPYATRFPGARLPGAFATGNLRVPASIFFEASGQTQQVHAPLAVDVAVLDDLVVVVYPDGARSPLQLVYGGRGTPWTSVDLPLAFGTVRDLDAVAGPDGRTVHILARTNTEVHYLRWTADVPQGQGLITGQLVHEPLDVPIDLDQWQLGACRDLSLDVRDDGTVDGVYLTRLGIRHVQRDPDGTWSDGDVVVHPDDTPTVDANGAPVRVFDSAETVYPVGAGFVGCRSRLTYDDTGLPLVVSLGIPGLDGALAASQVDFSNKQNTFFAATMGANGVFQHTGPLPTQDFRVFADSRDSTTWTGRFDAVRSPEGVPVTGIAWDRGLLWLQPWSLRGGMGEATGGPADDNPYSRDFCPDCPVAPGSQHPMHTDSIQIDACGRASLWVPWSFQEIGGGVSGPPRRWYLLGTQSAGTVDCTSNTWAPVVDRGEGAMEDANLRTVVWSHGQFGRGNVGLCLGNDLSMTICSGGYGSPLEPAGVVGDGTEPVRIVSASVGPGTLVAPDVPAIEVTLSSDPIGLPEASVALLDTTLGVRLDPTVTWDPTSRTVRLVPARPLAEGHGFRVELTLVHASIRHREGGAHVAFRTTGTVFHGDDPRDAGDQPFTDCERDADDLCVFEVPAEAGSTLTLASSELRGRPYPTSGSVLTAPDASTPWVSTRVDMLHTALTVTFEEALEPGVTYTLETPAQYDRFGRQVGETTVRVRAMP
ncbi:MAG: hypothetical protein KC656_11165, partial [Myxococcales bacterium]|nr:hypothetical protein [Myxococcales bacterium]